MVFHEGSLSSEDQQAELSSDTFPASSVEVHPVRALEERPLTHRNRRNSATLDASGPTSSSLRRCNISNSKPRRVVYLDHVHTHHHHHFHTKGDWGVAGDLPPEAMRLSREAKVERNIQRAHMQRDESQPASLSSGPAGRSSKQGSTPRMRRPLPPPAVPVGIAPAEGLSPTMPVWDMSESDSFVNANLNSLSDTNGNGHHGNGHHGNGHHQLPQHSKEAPPKLLPMPEYFSLIASLPPAHALEFSPYSLSRSQHGFCRCLGPMP